MLNMSLVTPAESLSSSGKAASQDRLASVFSVVLPMVHIFSLRGTRM